MLGRFGLGMLGVLPAGLGTLPGVDSGMFGMPGLAGGNLVLVPAFVGLPIIGSIGLILEVGEEVGGVLVGILTGSLAGGVAPSGGIPVSGVVVASVAAGFFLTEPVVFGLVLLLRRIFLIFFFLRPRFVWTDTVLTWEGVWCAVAEVIRLIRLSGEQRKIVKAIVWVILFMKT
jgi:hypothetical protein